MRSKWITHQGKQIFYQDFSNLSIEQSDLVKEELLAVQEVVMSQPENSVLVLANFTDTPIGRDLMGIMQNSSNLTKQFVRKTAVLGVTGTKRILANMLMSLTGQKLVMFENEEEAKDWLVKD